MLRPRVLKHWSKIVGATTELKIPESMREVLADDPELTTTELKKWVLRECDVSALSTDRAYWMPHRVVSGAIVKVYYVYIGPEPPKYTLVLAIGGGCVEIHKWTGNDLEIIKATIEEKPTASQPDIAESMKILEYLSKFKGSEKETMTVNGAKVASFTHGKK